MKPQAELLPLDLLLGNHLRRHRSLTVADLMKAGKVTMREAYRCLAEFEGMGRLVRSGGGPGEAFRWSTLPARQRIER